MGHFFRRFFTSTKGATAIEYALIAGLIAVVCIGAMQTIGTNMQSKMTSIGTALQ